MSDNILQYESKIWSTADLLRGSGIKESEWPSMMMPFFALVMIESRLVRMFDELRAEIGEADIKEMDKEDLIDLVRDKGQGYNAFIFERNLTLKDICKNDKTFDLDFAEYLDAFDGETKGLLGVEVGEGEKFLDIRGVVTKLKAKKVLLSYTKDWSAIDLRPFNNSEITTLEEHIKRTWADMSAETAGEQYTPDDIISLISEIIASKIQDSDKLLKIYDCTCGGGNLLFGVEDRIKQKFKRFTATYGQDWNDALYAMARIESRFRDDSKIEYGNTLNDDKFSTEEFDVATANPPYGVDWKGYAKSIEDDKTERFKFRPSVSDGQLLFMQHIIAKLNATGLAVVVHNSSSLTGDAGSAESNIRKWMLDEDLVEAIIQNPTDEFFNTPIYTYLWVINKNKHPTRKDKILLIDASECYRTLGKKKGDKGREIDASNRAKIINALNRFESCEIAKCFTKFHFYHNRQAIELTNLDTEGRTFASRLPVVLKRSGIEERATSEKLDAKVLTDGKLTLSEFVITTFNSAAYGSLRDAFEQHWKPLVAAFDYRNQPLVVTTRDGSSYHFDQQRETIVKTTAVGEESLGCGRIIVKVAFKLKTRKDDERIEISVELTPDYEKDYEVIPFSPNPAINQAGIEAFMAKHISRPFRYAGREIGVEINFTREFYKPLETKNNQSLADSILEIDNLLKSLAQEQELIRKAIQVGVDGSVGLKKSGVSWLGAIPVHWKVERIGTAFRERSEKVNDIDFPPLSVTKNGIVPQLDSAAKSEDRGNRKRVAKGDYVINSRSDRRGSSGLSNYDGSVSLINIVLEPRRNFHGRFLHHLFRSHHFIEEFYKSGRGMVDDLWTTKYSVMKAIEFAFPPNIDEQEAIASFLDDRSEKLTSLVSALESKARMIKDLKVLLLAEGSLGRVQRS